jgi:hypothetical protein
VAAGPGGSSTGPVTPDAANPAEAAGGTSDAGIAEVADALEALPAQPASFSVPQTRTTARRKDAGSMAGNR